MVFSDDCLQIKTDCADCTYFFFSLLNVHSWFVNNNNNLFVSFYQVFLSFSRDHFINSVNKGKHNNNDWAAGMLSSDWRVFMVAFGSITSHCLGNTTKFKREKGIKGHRNWKESRQTSASWSWLCFSFLVHMWTLSSWFGRHLVTFPLFIHAITTNGALSGCSYLYCYSCCPWVWFQ